MTVADLKKILDSMPENMEIVVNVRKSDLDWIITNASIVANEDDSRIVVLNCGTFEDPSEES